MVRRHMPTVNDRSTDALLTLEQRCSAEAGSCRGSTLQSTVTAKDSGHASSLTCALTRKWAVCTVQNQVADEHLRSAFLTW